MILTFDRWRLRARFGVTLLALGGIACNQTPEGQVPVFPAQGQVLYKGKPLADALVVLHQPGSSTQGQPSVPRPTGRTDGEGKFRLHTYTGDDGAPEGIYQVAISFAPPPADHADFLKKAASKQPPKATPDILQMRYTDPAKSNLKAEIKAGENVLPPYDLQ